MACVLRDIHAPNEALIQRQGDLAQRRKNRIYQLENESERFFRRAQFIVGKSNAKLEICALSLSCSNSLFHADALVLQLISV